jgi:hypothetical protein
MGDTDRRALVAALLGALGASFGIAGVGHAYLREWRRSVAWFTFVLGSMLVLVSVFADPSQATTDVDSLPLTVVVPIIVLLSLNVFDAYYLARRGPLVHSNPNATCCPHCGGEVDPDLQFCHWCTEPLSTHQSVDVEPQTQN